MKQIPLRPVLIGLVALVAIVGLTRVVPTAAPSSTNGISGGIDGQCSSDRHGVSLVIDFGEAAGRDAMLKCVPGVNLPGNSASNALSGWQLFSAAGIDVVGTTEYPVGFACRIADWPPVADQPCTSTPTYSQGHWAYFYANQTSNQHWAFSGAGAAEHKPQCGDVEGWLFVKGDGASGTQANREPSPKPQVFSCAP